MSETASQETKRGRKKKTLGYPKRPLSAYNIFYQHERQKMLLEELKKSPLPPHMIQGVFESGRDRPHRKRHGRIPFQHLVRTVATKWKNIEPMAKKVYEEQAKIEKQRYILEIEAWKRSHDQLGNKIHPSFLNQIPSDEHEVVKVQPTIFEKDGESSIFEKNIHPIEQKSSLTSNSDNIGTPAWLASELDSSCLDFFVSTFGSESKPNTTGARTA